MFQQVTLYGRLGADPELRHTQSGTPVVRMRVVTTEWIPDKQGGEGKEKQTWHSVIAWQRLGEACAKHLVKGQVVLVSGKIDNRSWENKDGTKGYASEIVAREVRFGQKPNAQGGGQQRSSQPEQQPSGDGEGDFGGGTPNLSDIPF